MIIKSKGLIIIADMGAFIFLEPLIDHIYKKKTFDLVIFANKKIKREINKKFNHKLIFYNNNLNQIYKKYSIYKFAIISTAALSFLEIKVLKFLKSKNIKTYSFSDNWTNFKDRYTYKSKTIYPDKIFLIDRIAKKRSLNENIPSNKLLITGSPYIEKSIIFNKNNIKKSEEIINILFISEPLVNFPKTNLYSNFYTEFEVVTGLLSELKRIKEKYNLNYILKYKQHPYSDKVDKSIIKELKKSNIKIIKNETLSQSIKKFDIIIGMKSFGLIEAAMQGKITISIQPIQKKYDNFVGNIKKIVIPIYDFKKIHNYLNFKIPKSKLDNLKKMKKDNCNSIIKIISFIKKDLK